MIELILSYLVAFAGCYLIIPSVINVAKVKHLFGDINDRSSHTVKTPPLGGVAIFVGFIFSLVYFIPYYVFKDLQYTLCGFIIIFLIGFKDDIIPMTPFKKLLGQIMAALVVMLKSGIKFQILIHFFGENPFVNVVSILITLFTILIIINGFNLIDGINGLSGATTVLVSITLGFWFYLMKNEALAIMAFCLAGAVSGFLRYNFTPAQIFMGDTGALLCGLVTSILIIQFVNMNYQYPNNAYTSTASPVMAFGILILPLFDTARVIIIRFLKKKSIFSADRLHIHHLLLDSGYSHMQATGILTLLSSLFIMLVFLFKDLKSYQLLGLIILVLFTLGVLFTWKHKPSVKY